MNRHTLTSESSSVVPAQAAPRPEPWEPRLRYHAWILRHLPAPADLTRQRLAARRWQHPPLISIITPIYDTPPEMLRRMVRSVQRQSYPHWELCLVDDGSPSPWVGPYLERLAAGDARIRLARRAANGGIVAASNDALALATGTFVALLDDDDELDPRALYALAREIVAQPEVDVLYTDFDVIGTDGIRYEPVLAPGWSPELLLSIPYIVHLTAYRRALVEQVGGFRPAFEGSQDYDLALRLTRLTSRVVHIPQVLYHWRAWSRSAAGNPSAKPYAYEAGVRAITDHLRGHAFEAWREEGPALGLHTVRFAIRDTPLVSVVMPLLPRHAASPDEPVCARDLATALHVLAAMARATAYARVEWIVVGADDAAAAAMRGDADSRAPIATASAGAGDCDSRSDSHRDSDDAPAALAGVRFVACDGPPDGALLANAGAAQAHGEYLLFLGDPLEPLTADWLTALLEFAQQPGIGAVGPKIYRADATIWHAGIIVPRAAPHLVWRDDLVTRNYSAVSGACLMTSRAAFDAAGGFQPADQVGCSDVDYCLRLRERGERVVLTPHARLRHAAEAPAEAGPAARATFHRVWRDRMMIDPYYNPNYRQDAAWFAVALD